MVNVDMTAVIAAGRNRNQSRPGNGWTILETRQFPPFSRIDVIHPVHRLGPPTIAGLRAACPLSHRQLLPGSKDNPQPENPRKEGFMMITRTLLAGAFLMTSATALAAQPTSGPGAANAATPAVPATPATPATPADPTTGTAAIPATPATPATPAEPAATADTTDPLQRPAETTAETKKPVKKTDKKKPR
jgi:hypothetical protein